MPACPEEDNFRGLIDELRRVDCRFGLVLSKCSLSAGDYKENYKIKKGGSDPLSLFGPQAGRKEGVAPALFASPRPACDLSDLMLVLYCLDGSEETTGGKPKGKP